VRQALIVLWEASDRICGKRLKPLLPVLLPALERHGHVSLDLTVRANLMAVSAATIDRMLSGVRASASMPRCAPFLSETSPGCGLGRPNRFNARRSGMLCAHGNSPPTGGSSSYYLSRCSC
jgi:hypothetical protein